MTQLLEWVKQFEAESHQSDEEVAFSVFLGDLNFDNCSPGKAHLPLVRKLGRRWGFTHRTPSTPQSMHWNKSTRFSVTFETPAG